MRLVERAVFGKLNMLLCHYRSAEGGSVADIGESGGRRRTCRCQWKWYGGGSRSSFQRVDFEIGELRCLIRHRKILDSH